MEMEGLSLSLKHICPSRKFHRPLLCCFSLCCYYPHFRELSKNHYNALSLRRPRKNLIPKAVKQAHSTNTGDNSTTEVREEDGYEEEDDYMSAARVKMGSLYDEGGGDAESSTLLSLSEKPYRNTALLDDYESEELEFATDITGHFSDM